MPGKALVTKPRAKARHHVIYVPGILDDLHHQSWAVKTWRLYGVHGHCHVMPWEGDEDYEPKLRRLLDEIDGYRSEGHIVSLVGASAGASAVINAYMERKADITGLVCFVAKINAPETVSKKVYAANPAFRTSMRVLQDNLRRLTPQDKEKMHSFYSPGDRYVPYEATVIPGVKETRLPPLNHGKAITYALTLGARSLLKPLKQLAKTS